MTTVNNIDASSVAASFAVEATPKVLPATPVWYATEPNSFGDFGPTVSTTARKFISADRQENKGGVTDLDVACNLNQDLTSTNFTMLLQGFLFANAREKPSTRPFNGTAIAITSVATGGVYNAAAGLAIFPVGTIVCAKGFAFPSNLGFGLVTADSATVVTCAAEATVAEVPPTTAYLVAVGVQAGAADLVLSYASPLVSMTSTTLNLSTLGLNIGEWIFIGGDTAATQFAGGSGFARIASIAAHLLTFDKCTFTPFADAGAGKTVQLFFGTVVRNENLSSNIIKRTYQFERALGNDAVGPMGEYVTGATPNTFKFNQPAPGKDAKYNIDLDFAALGHETYDGTVGLKAGTRIAAPGEQDLSVTADLYRARIAAVDPTTPNPAALVGYLTEANFTLNNNTTVNKAAGVLGGMGTSLGTLASSGTITAYFNGMPAIRAIRAYGDVTIDFIICKKNAGIIFDFPLVGLGNGRLTVDIDKPVMMPLDTGAFKSPNGYQCLVNTFQYLPNLAMPNN